MEVESYPKFKETHLVKGPIFCFHEKKVSVFNQFEVPWKETKNATRCFSATRNRNLLGIVQVQLMSWIKLPPPRFPVTTSRIMKKNKTPAKNNWGLKNKKSSTKTEILDATSSGFIKKTSTQLRFHQHHQLNHHWLRFHQYHQLNLRSRNQLSSSCLTL